MAAALLLQPEQGGTSRSSRCNHRGKELWEEVGSERREMHAFDPSHLMDSSRALSLVWEVLKIRE